MEELLKVNDISMVFGGLRAVSNFSMTINKGELIGLIGPNGAGKTTAFNMITGVYTPTEGEIIFNGTKTSGKKSYQVTQLGMARTFQNIRLFSELSVIDNVKVAYNMHVKYGLVEAIGRFGRYFDEEDKNYRNGNGFAENLPSGRQGGRACQKPSLRRAAPSGNRACAGNRAEAFAFGRTGGRHEPAGNQRTDGAYPLDTRKI